MSSGVKKKGRYKEKGGYCRSFYELRIHSANLFRRSRLMGDLI
jgi:hypothetical protein